MLDARGCAIRPTPHKLAYWARFHYSKKHGDLTQWNKYKNSLKNESASNCDVLLSISFVKVNLANQNRTPLNYYIILNKKLLNATWLNYCTTRSFSLYLITIYYDRCSTSRRQTGFEGVVVLIENNNCQIMQLTYNSSVTTKRNFWLRVTIKKNSMKYWHVCIVIYYSASQTVPWPFGFHSL